jgi:hypothetical protein
MSSESGIYTESELSIKGSYILTSAASNEKAFFDSGKRNTFFSSELFNVMKNGIPSEGPVISLDKVYRYLCKTVYTSTKK